MGKPHETGNFELGGNHLHVKLVNQQSVWKGEKFRKGSVFRNIFGVSMGGRGAKGLVL